MNGANTDGPAGPEVVLSLEHACIETAAKRARWRVVDGLVESDDADGSLAARLALLDDFLASQDFPALRAADRDVAGGSPWSVVIRRDEAGRVVWSKAIAAGQGVGPPAGSGPELRMAARTTKDPSP